MADQATLTSVLRACTAMALLELGRHMEDARFEFSRMVEKDVISCSTMIIGLAQNGFSHEALEIFQGRSYFESMEKVFGIKAGREHYGCMVDLLGRAGKFDEAVELIHNMEPEPDAVTWRTLLAHVGFTATWI
ncbi:pentatricopeptide repeat-containing protein [Tanacetum coccineum]